MASKSTEKMVWRPNVVKAYLHPLIVKAWHNTMISYSENPKIACTQCQHTEQREPVTESRLEKISMEVPQRCSTPPGSLSALKTGGIVGLGSIALVPFPLLKARLV